LIRFIFFGYSQAHVYNEGADVYDVMLNQVNIEDVTLLFKSCCFFVFLKEIS